MQNVLYEEIDRLKKVNGELVEALKIGEEELITAYVCVAGMDLDEARKLDSMKTIRAAIQKAVQP